LELRQLNPNLRRNERNLPHGTESNFVGEVVVMSEQSSKEILCKGMHWNRVRMDSTSKARMRSRVKKGLHLFPKCRHEYAVQFNVGKFLYESFFLLLSFFSRVG